MTDDFPMVAVRRDRSRRKSSFLLTPHTPPSPTIFSMCTPPFPTFSTLSPKRAMMSLLQKPRGEARLKESGRCQIKPPSGCLGMANMGISAISFGYGEYGNFSNIVGRYAEMSQPTHSDERPIREIAHTRFPLGDKEIDRAQFRVSL